MRIAIPLKRSSIFISCALILIGEASASTDEMKNLNRPNVGYNLDLRLGYYNVLQNPFNDSETSNSAHSAGTTGQERTLGLTRARAQIWWWLPGESRLNVILRPDAVNGGEERSEFDSRAGRFYRKRPKIKLLDAYTLEKQFGDQLSMRVGVIEELVKRRMAYNPVLEFGLEVQLPQRTSAAEIEWRLMQILPDHQPPQPSSGWIFSLIGFQGDQDRAELREFSEESYDETPTSKDPHYGASFSLTRIDGHRNRFSLMVGISDNRYIEVNNNGDIAGTGKRNEVFGQLANEFMLTDVKVPTKFAFEYRLSKEKWKGDSIEVSPRTHQSMALTASLRVGHNKWVLVGGHYGTSKYSDDVIASGYQGDIGYKFVVAPNLWVTAVSTEEHRQLKDEGRSVGAFQRADGQTKKVLRRYALEVAYQLEEG